MSKQIIQRGAEANIIRDHKKIIKKRIKKGYRISVLDNRIRTLRTRAEAKLLEKARKAISTVPKVISVDEDKKEIVMDFEQGKRLSEKMDPLALKEQKKICSVIGFNISRLHNEGIIHGDLTTSNMILNSKSQVYFIDFGLGYISQRIEDMAVDLHLLKEALEAKHFQHWEILFDSVLEGYKNFQKSDAVLNQLKKVETRGRYKEKY